MARIKRVDDVATETIETTSDNTAMADIIARLNRLERENEELKNQQANPNAKAKEHYKGPLKASYWLWGGVPVISYKSVKKNPEYDFLYKDGAGVWVNNHYVKLTLADGTEPKPVLRDSFDTSKVLSDKKEFGVVDKDGTVYKKCTTQNIKNIDPAKYVFSDDTYGDIEVDFNCIN